MSWVKRIILWNLLLTITQAFNTVLNVEELNSIHYAVDILNKPVLKEKAWQGEVMTVFNKHGQEYVCSLPHIVLLDSQSKKDDNIFDQLVDISVLLKPMETAPCLIKTVDWWTYEFCYSSVIKQYHLEDNKASGPILILGKYESEYNWKNSSETKNRLQRFHSQFYVNGTKCDLTNEPRRTEIRFHCEDGVGDYIQRVDEPESCRYVVTVATTRVCHHPYLRMQGTDSPNSITCSPALTQDQYDRYLRYQELKTREEESSRARWLKNAEILSEVEGLDGKTLANSNQDNADTDYDDLKMNIKIFRLNPLKKMAPEIREAVAIETHITLQETDAGGTNIIAPEDTQDIEMTNVDENNGTPGEPGISTDDMGQMTVEKDDQDFMNILTNDDEVDNNEEDDEDEDDDEEEDEEEEDIDVDDDKIQSETNIENNSDDKKADKLQDLLGDGNKELSDKIPGDAALDDESIADLQKMVESIREGRIKQLEDEVEEWTNKLLDKNLFDLDETEMEDEEQRLGKALSSLMDSLDTAEDKLFKARADMETLEEFLDSQLQEMESEDSQEQSPQDLPKDSQETRPTSPHPQDPTEGESQQAEQSTDGSRKGETKKIFDKGSKNLLSQHILKGNDADEEKHKNQLEEKIKDKLQKLGLEKIENPNEKSSIFRQKLLELKSKVKEIGIPKETSVIEKSIREKLVNPIQAKLEKRGILTQGRKFEVKILTPNSLEDDDKNSLSSMSQEETEAFQNMIVNLLSANAEEIEEREHHKKLEKNYGFNWDDIKMPEDEDTKSE